MQTTLNCNGRLLTLNTPIVMGIINVNEDSFYPASRATSIHQILSKAEKMLKDGASILDLGAMSSRPGARIMDIDVELNGIIPAVESVCKEFPDAVVSVDTLRSKVAELCVHSGASMVNDISAGDFDPEMIQIMTRMKVPYVMMHMQGLPATMQQNPTYTDVLMEVLKYFVEKVHKARLAGITDILIDPGFGFGKTLDQNYTLMRHLEVFKIFDFPVLAGISRKSLICKALNINQEDALNGSTALHMVALQRGASVLRVHDVKEAVECVKLYKRLTD
ncbi:MAG: dihydropteroate synthase [Saprospiraceae bacterium]|nr:dihydropteroate synthase [Saprospiraceae bacterium]